MENTNMDEIKQLKSPYKEMAQRWAKEKTIYGDSNSLERSFDWEETPEGYKFWASISQKDTYPEITEKIKSYHPELFPKSKGLPEEFGILVENENGREILNFLKDQGYDIWSIGTGQSGLYFGICRRLMSTGQVFCGTQYDVKSTGIKTFTLNEAKQMIETKQEESKKVIGYKTPIDLFGGSVKAGTVFTKVESTNNWYIPNPKNVTGQSVPKEIVETWEPVLAEEEFKKGDFIVFEKFHENNSGEFTIGKVYELRGDFIDYRLMVSEDDRGSKTNGFSSKVTMKTIKFRKATPAEVEAHKKSKLEKKIGVGSKEKIIIIKADGKITIGSEYTNIYVVKAIIEDYTKVDGDRIVGTSWKVKVAENVRFIQVGCDSEKNLFSIAELQTVVSEYEKLKK